MTERFGNVILQLTQAMYFSGSLRLRLHFLLSGQSAISALTFGDGDRIDAGGRMSLAVDSGFLSSGPSFLPL